MLDNKLHNIVEYEILDWQLGESLGSVFEREIFQIINSQIADKFIFGVRSHQTKTGPDGGKDIIIHSPVSLDILNQHFDLGTKSEITIYIECKSSDSKRIDLAKVASSQMRVKENKADYYVLISNSSFTPQTLYILNTEFESAGINFKVIDQYFLLKALKCKTVIRNKSFDIKPKLYYEYQVSTTRVDNKNAYELFFSYRNLEDEDQLITQRLLTDNNWSVDKSEQKFFVNSNGIYLTKIMVVRDFSDGINDLLFSVENNGITEKQISINGVGLRPVFEPPFWGEAHKDCESTLSQRIRNSSKFDLCCIWGEAGIGKTRIFNEIFKQLNGQGLDFFAVSVRANNKYLSEIKKFLINKHYLHKNDNSLTLNKMLSSAKNDYMRAVILIDDCHNLTDNTLNDLKTLIGESLPITIVLCGRTDYSVGTTDYYSFVHYTERDKDVWTWKLTTFSDTDTKNFIRFIIKSIPEVALEKIWRMSNNNPLFIIHFIEYLLELNLVELCNRNLVGISNVSSFSSRLNVPQKVEEIYKKRIDYLKNSEKEAEIFIEYFYILSILQDKQPKEAALKCLSEEKLNFLIERRFLDLSENGEVIFSHESFAIFVRQTLENSQKLKYELANKFFGPINFLLEFLSAPEKGMLALWAKKESLANTYFDSIIKRISDITNHSALNVDCNDNRYLIYIMQLLAKNRDKKELLIKVIKTKIYTSIHHFSPINAINECNDTLKFLDKNRMLKDNKCLRNSIKQQKAHAMIIAGYMCDAELIMKELLSDWLKHKETLDEDTLFDLFDRFCGIYIDMNCKDIAINFNEMSKEKAAADNRLMALVYLNRAKIYFLTDFDIADASLLEVQDLLKNGDSQRIFCSSKISLLMIALLHKKRSDYSNMLEEARIILKEALDGSYAHSVARLYLIMAVLHLLSAEPLDKLEETKNLIDIGINYCIKFGFQREAWEFYNLLAIVQIRNGADAEEIRKTFATVFSLLQKHDYLQIGMRDLCCDNLLVLSNIGFFYQSKKTEKEFYEFVTKISFYGDSAYSIKEAELLPKKFLRKEYLKAKQRQLLFVDTPNVDLLKDTVTNYFIALS